MSLNGFINNIDSYLGRLKGLLDSLDISTFERAVSVIDSARRVFICGNGGSQANASHLLLHLREAQKDAVDLIAELPLLTALSNDYGYDEAVRRQLRQMATSADCLVAFSGSGNSRNICLALLAAKTMGLRTVGFLGFGGGDAKTLCDVAVILDSKDYGIIEDIHSTLIHLTKNQLDSK